MQPNLGPHSQRSIAGRYAMPRLRSLAEMTRVLLAGLAIFVVGGTLVGFHSPWGLPVVTVGCLLVTIYSIFSLVHTRRFWIFAGRPLQTPDVLPLLIFGAIWAAVTFAFLVVEIARALAPNG